MNQARNVFRDAIPFIRPTHEGDKKLELYICSALLAAVEKTWPRPGRASLSQTQWFACQAHTVWAGKARYLISRALGRHVYVNSWLIEHCPEFREINRLDWRRGMDLVQAYRIAWCTQLADLYDAGEINLENLTWQTPNPDNHEIRSRSFDPTCFPQMTS